MKVASRTIEKMKKRRDHPGECVGHTSASLLEFNFHSRKFTFIPQNSSKAAKNNILVRERRSETEEEKEIYSKLSRRFLFFFFFLFLLRSFSLKRWQYSTSLYFLSVYVVARIKCPSFSLVRVELSSYTMLQHEQNTVWCSLLILIYST